MESWISYDHEIQSRCGFCDARLMSWTERVEHLAAHFKQGKTMDDWTGGHEFEPYVEQFVENAVPPFLIAMEKKTPDPFSASNPSHAFQAPDTSDFTAKIHCIHHLDEQLRGFIKTQVTQGHVPSDMEIQNHARILVYGSYFLLYHPQCVKHLESVHVSGIMTIFLPFVSSFIGLLAWYLVRKNGMLTSKSRTEYDDPWNQTRADNPVWLDLFKKQNGLITVSTTHDLNAYIGDDGYAPRYKSS